LLAALFFGRLRVRFEMLIGKRKHSGGNLPPTLIRGGIVYEEETLSMWLPGTNDKPKGP
jgi:hypothetical protein